MRRSDNITAGPERMPNRSLLRACGMTDEEMKQPIIGVVSAYSEIIPGHINLDKIADAVKAGVRMAGGTPVLVPAIGVCDGIAMGHIGMKYSLASRELIADSVETMLSAHAFDAMICIPNCDKIVPGMIMGALRCNIPTIFCSGGPMAAGMAVDGTVLDRRFPRWRLTPCPPPGAAPGGTALLLPFPPARRGARAPARPLRMG